MINLNDEKFNAGSGSAIFNGNIAGKVENVTVSIEKKGADEKEKAPDYRVVFTDSSGGTLNIGYWYISGPDNYGNSEDDRIRKQGTALKHLVHAICGEGAQIPTFSDAQGMLDGVMQLLRKATPTAGQFRVFTNYGTPKNSQEYIQMRTWVPFIEPMSVADEDSRLVPGSFDNMEQLVADKTSVGGGAKAETAVEDEGW
jgi:hypothetical protein